MNRHTKMAILVAPFLLIGGYIASGYYMDYQAKQLKIIELHPKESCNVLEQKCVLSAGEFQINVYDRDALTQVNSTFPLDKVTLFLVDNTGKATPYLMEMGDNPYYWKTKTNLRLLINNDPISNDFYKLRLIAEIKGGRYISEFYTASE